MTLQVTIGFNSETLSAIADLAAAIRSAIGGAAPATAPAAAVIDKSNDKGDAVTIYWGNHAKAAYGIVESEEAYAALKKKDSKLVKLTKAQYDKKLAEIEAAKGGEAEEEEEQEIPSEEALIEAFSTYLPAEGLDEDTKKERRLVVKAIAKRFGAAKASEISEEHRALAINLVQRVDAGQDIDVTKAKFEKFEAEEDDAI